MISQNTKSKMEPELLTLKETCELLRCHPNTLRQWDKKGILTAVRFGERKDRRYRRNEVMDFISRKRT